MTDWKDPLLARWWAGCSEETRLALADAPEAWSPILVLISLQSSIDALPRWEREQEDKMGSDLDRLRDLIDAELREGREAQRWRDMDAAPRDGRAVVLRRRGGKADIGEFHNGSWCFKTEYGISRWEEKWFTDWLPLPETDSP
jgi:hypothetical protein